MQQKKARYWYALHILSQISLQAVNTNYPLDEVFVGLDFPSEKVAQRYQILIQIT